MTLVTYSDSEGDDERNNGRKDESSTTFSIDRSNPRKIQVKLAAETAIEDEPPPKRPRMGEGAFRGFNAMLPPPKREGQIYKSQPVKSLKTSSEPAFTREGNYEPAFSQEESFEVAADTIPDPPKKGNAMIFKPLSVARKKKLIPRKDATRLEKSSTATPKTAGNTTLKKAPKVSLFGSTEETLPESKDEIEEVVEEANEEAIAPTVAPEIGSTQSLASIANDLNLSPSARRQLLGRDGKLSGQAISIVNFNTDVEYAANEEIRSSGQQVTHNPMRSIAPGKHSLKQLVNAASGQKEALEESFAVGKRTKKEAGSKYGW